MHPHPAYLRRLGVEDVSGVLVFEYAALSILLSRKLLFILQNSLELPRKLLFILQNLVQDLTSVTLPELPIPSAFASLLSSG